MDEDNLKKAYFLMEHEAISLLSGFAIPYPDHGFAKDLKKAQVLANEIGYPVVLKVMSPQIVHKSDVGGVITNIKNSSEFINAFRLINNNVAINCHDAEIVGYLVCRQVEPGQEFIVGSSYDDIFGPTLMFGLGGVFAEVFKEVSFRVCPISERDAREMIMSVRGSDVLNGFRGKPVLDTEAIVSLLMEISSLITHNHSIKEIDLNPIRVYEKGVMVLDVRVLVDPL